MDPRPEQPPDIAGNPEELDRALARRSSDYNLPVRLKRKLRSQSQRAVLGDDAAIVPYEDVEEEGASPSKKARNGEAA